MISDGVAYAIQLIPRALAEDSEAIPGAMEMLLPALDDKLRELRANAPEGEPRFTDPKESRPTRIADAILDAAKDHDEFQPGDKVIVLYHGVENVGGSALAGYESDQEIQKELIAFCQQMFAAMGSTFHVIPMSRN